MGIVEEVDMGDDQEKSGVQKAFTGPVSPSVRERMEAESRQWMVKCPYCGYQRSVWETGGVRYKASGRARQLMRCPNCKRLAWQIIYKPKGPEDAGPPTVSPEAARTRWRLWVFGLASIVVLIVLFVVGLLWLVGNLTQAIVTPGDAFMAALRDGSYDKAYALCTPDLQKQLGSASGLAPPVQGYQPGKWSWSGRSIRNTTGTLDGSLTYANGKPGTVHLSLEQVGSDWRISGFRMNPTQ